MSDRDFEKWQARTEVHGGFTSRRDFDAGYQYAVEHCKKGEPVCYANPEDLDMKTYPDLAFNFPVRTKQGGNFTQPLFTHAMPKSEGKPVAEVYAVNKADGDGNVVRVLVVDLPQDTVTVGTKIFATQQPSTDVSELVQALEDMVFLCEKANQRCLDQIGMGLIDIVGISKSKALITKHTVK